MKTMKKVTALLVTLALMIGMIPCSLFAVTAAESEGYPSIALGETTTVAITEVGQYAYLEFVPESDGYYAFYSNATEDTVGDVLDANMNQLAYNDDGGEGYNFFVTCYMNAGATYYLQSRYYSSNRVGSFEVGIKEAVLITAMEVTSLPTNNVFVRDVWPDDVDFSGLTMNFTMSDGSVVEWAYGEENQIEGQDIYINYDRIVDTGVVEITADNSSATASYSVTLIDNPVESIEVLSGSVKPIIENTGGYLTSNDDYFDEPYYIYDSINFDNVVVQINYKDGSTATAGVNDVVNNYGLYWTSEQYSDPWTLGSDNYLTLSYLGATAQLPVTVIEHPVESIEIVSGSVKPIIECMNGEWRTRYNEETDTDEQFFYYESPNVNDIVIQINYKDGSTATTSVDQWVDGYYVSFYSDQFDTPWTLGSDNYITVTYMSKEIQIPVTVIENPVESIEVLSGGLRPIIENTNGYWETRYNEETGVDEQFFCYSESVIDSNDVVVQINYTDGSTVTARIGEWVNDYCVGWNFDQYNDPWTLGSDNYITVSYLDKEVLVPVTVIEHPVESIEVISGSIKPMVENTYGYWNTRYNEETDTNEEFFYYEIYSFDFSDIVIQINYKDGSTTTARVWEWVDDYYIDCRSDQHNTPWTVGSDNYLTVTYMGVESEGVPVTIIENPVESIEVISGSVKPIVEYTNGYWNTRYNEETDTEEQFFYYYQPDLYDIVVQINYKDGSTTTARVGDLIDGYWVDYVADQYYQPWTLGSDNYLTLKYMGVESERIPVTVIETPVESIEIVSGSVKPIIECMNGEWNTRYNEETDTYEEFFYYYTPDFNDLVVQINYKDGSTTTARVWDAVGDYSIDWSSDQYNDPWTLGSDNYLTITYMGVESESIPVTIIENPVESIEVISGSIEPMIENVDGYWDYRYNEEIGTEEQFFYYYQPDLYDIVVQINYKDGSTTTARVGNLIDGYWVDYVADQYYQPWTLGSDNYITIKYMDVETQIPVTIVADEEPDDALPGDADGDGAVTTRDAVLIQQYLNGWDVVIDSDASDVNDDGLVNIKDTVLIRQYLNGWNVELT